MTGDRLTVGVAVILVVLTAITAVKVTHDCQTDGRVHLLAAAD